MWKCMVILENLEALGPEVSLALKESKALQGHRAPMAAMGDLETLGHQDILETPAEME